MPTAHQPSPVPRTVPFPAAQCLALGALVALLLAGLALGPLLPGAEAKRLVPPGKKVFLGVTDTGDAAGFRDFARTVGKHPPVIQTFHPWGNSLHKAMPRWRSVHARPMLHVTTRADNGTELI
ncbi:MAG: hypothetical protein M3Y45_02965, partial [Actinomycetota bacterium]|nr:hypothetical protein [Actinomycetota bacterium]